MARLVESSTRCRPMRTPSCSRLNHETWAPWSMAAWPSASRKWLLPVPDGPQTTMFSWRSIHSRVRNARWVGSAMEEMVSSQPSKILPVGNPAALRRDLTDEACRLVSSSAAVPGSLQRGPSVGLSRWRAGRGPRRACGGAATGATDRRRHPRGSRWWSSAEAFPRGGAGLQRMDLIGGTSLSGQVRREARARSPSANRPNPAA